MKRIQGLFCFADEETDSHGVGVTCQGHTTRWQAQTWSSSTVCFFLTHIQTMTQPTFTEIYYVQTCAGCLEKYSMEFSQQHCQADIINHILQIIATKETQGVSRLPGW